MSENGPFPSTPTATQRWTAPLVVLITFLLGVGCGAGALHLIAAHHRGGGQFPPHGGLHGEAPLMDDAMLDHLAQELGLSAEQREQVRPLIEAGRKRVHQALLQTHEELTSILTDKQREQLSKMMPPMPPPPPPAPPLGSAPR